MSDNSLISVDSEIELYSNCKQKIIRINEDKVELILRDFKKHITKDWIGPLALFVTLVTTIISVEFKDYGISADTWQAIYIIGTFFSLVWLVSVFLNMWLYRKKADIKIVIEKMKNTSIS